MLYVENCPSIHWTVLFDSVSRTDRNHFLNHKKQKNGTLSRIQRYELIWKWTKNEWMKLTLNHFCVMCLIQMEANACSSKSYHINIWQSHFNPFRESNIVAERPKMKHITSLPFNVRQVENRHINIINSLSFVCIWMCCISKSCCRYYCWMKKNIS